MRMNNAITTLVGEEFEGYKKWSGTLAAPNGSVYGIPYTTRRVSKFNPIDKSITYIGPDFGDTWQWYKGAITDSGVIYCPPVDSSHRGILNIDTNTNTVIVLDVNLLPEQGDYKMWMSCAAALDGCIYFMPYGARRIMKLDPNNNDAMSSVGDDLGDEGWKYIGTVVGIDGCVYGIPSYSKRIIKYDPSNDTTSIVGDEADEYFLCSGGAIGRDGCIYAFASNGGVLKIDTANNNNSYCFVGISIQSAHGINAGDMSDAVLGIDGCIYWPPKHAKRTLKYDPHSNQTSLVGDNFDCCYTGGSLATDGVIYCMPPSAKQVLAIDPLGEFSLETKANMEEHPEEFGFLFQNNAKGNNSDTDTDILSNRTNFDCAVTKFGMQTVLEIVHEYLPPAAKEVRGLYPFMLAASYKESPLSVVYLLLRQVPFLVKSNSDDSDSAV